MSEALPERADSSEAPPAVDTAGHRLGSVYVLLQFALIGVLLVWAAPVFARAQAPEGAWSLAIAGLVLVLWAAGAHGRGGFNVHPAPRAGGRLVREGPYRWIRHPMYSAVMLCAIGAAWAIGSAGGGGAALGSGVAALALAAVLDRKARLEESWLARTHAGYAAYRDATRRFVPGVY
jgi:protein-S-isoprenylcysteine O-methyltransferase Ste14